MSQQTAAVYVTNQDVCIHNEVAGPIQIIDFDSKACASIIKINNCKTIIIVAVIDKSIEDRVIKSIGSRTVKIAEAIPDRIRFNTTYEYVKFFNECIAESTEDTLLNSLSIICPLKYNEDNEEEAFKYQQDLLHFIINTQFFRNTISGLIFTHANGAFFYKKCFNFLMKESCGLFNFSGRIIYNYSRKQNFLFEQCNNRLAFGNRFDNNYDAEQKIYALSIMLFCYIDGVTEDYEPNDRSHLRQHGRVRRESNDNVSSLVQSVDVYKKYIQDEMKKNKRLHPLIIGAANLISVNNENSNHIILNGLAVHHRYRHCKIGTQLLEHCLYVANPKPIKVHIPLNSFVQESEFNIDNAIRASKFFKNVTRDDNESFASSKYLTEDINYCGKDVKCASYILMNRNAA